MEKPPKNSQEKSTSNMVSVRLDHPTRKQLDSIGELFHLKRSDIARAYLKLCQTVVVNTNQNIEMFDGTQLCFYPKNLLKNYYSKLNAEELMELGDQMALIAYTNCQIKSLNTPLERLYLLEQLGWIGVKQIRLVDSEGKAWLYHAISAQDLPLDFVHALLYRLLFQKRLPNQLNAKDIKQNFKKINKRFKNTDFEKILPRFLSDMGPHIENFEDLTTLYNFDALRESIGEADLES